MARWQWPAASHHMDRTRLRALPDRLDFLGFDQPDRLAPAAQPHPGEHHTRQLPRVLHRRKRELQRAVPALDVYVRARRVLVLAFSLPWATRRTPGHPADSDVPTDALHG